MGIHEDKFGYITNCLEQNIEEYADCLKKFDMRIKQLSKGCFRGRSSIIKLLDCTLIRRTSIAKYSMTGRFDDNVTFAFPLNNGGIFFNGCFMDGQRQIVSPANAEGYAIIPEHFDQLLVSIPQSALSGYFDHSESELFLKLAKIIGNTRVDANRKRVLTMKLLDIFMSIYTSTEPLTPDCQRHHCQLILNLLLDYMASHQSHLYLKISNHEKILERAIRLVECNPTCQFTLDQMSKEIFASKRAIQYAFASILGISPMRFLKMQRINQVRGELAEVITSFNFSKVISKYSFSNASRMCREYQEHFGEHPKDIQRHSTGVQARN